MTSIVDPRLDIRDVPEDVGRCMVTVTYELDISPADLSGGQEFVTRVVVHSVDEHDAAVRPSGVPVLDVSEELVTTAGRHRRVVERAVRRIDLDVEQDWWSSGQGGETIPIAEWADHLAAEVSILVDGRVVAMVGTPTVTGSWGPAARRGPGE